MEKEKAIAFYTILIFGLGAMVTIDVVYPISFWVLLIKLFLFVIFMYIAYKLIGIVKNTIG